MFVQLWLNTERSSRLRKDAATRREKLIGVAAALFERDGYDIPLEAVIEAAGLGRGTLYRNFPDRAALMAAVLAHKVMSVERFVEEHQDDATLLKTFVRHQGLVVTLHSPAILSLQADASRKQELKLLTERASVLLETIVVRSCAAGTLRPDVTVNHLRLVTRMLMTTATEPAEEQAASLDMAIDIVMRGLEPRDA